MPFIKTQDLCFSYEDNGKSIEVLKKVNIEIYKGEYVAIIGHNGSGKSTLARLLNMILEPDSGKIFVDGKDITDENLTEDEMFDVRRRIGLVQQNPDNQIVATIVEEDVAFGPENLGIPSAEIRERVDKALEIVGMTQYARYEPHRLSGGQKQRIAIAGVLAMLPECIIFDESTAMLDPKGRKDVLKTVKQLNEEKGITVITVTHYMNEAAMADRIIVLDNGQVVAQGTPAQIFENERLLNACSLDVPQCTAVALGLKKLGYNLNGDIYDIPSCTEAIGKLLADTN
ncbi:MAG: energy-coupling factor transporter ATPase [Clostridia bacterium]|nr:energy-coupling factor transporter ATPase [Clostridia bacterium]